MAAKLFVGNLSFQATEEDLRELFAQAGTVETVRIITDQFTGRPRGFASEGEAGELVWGAVAASSDATGSAGTVNANP